MAWQRQLLLRERHRRARALGTDSELRVCAVCCGHAIACEPAKGKHAKGRQRRANCWAGIDRRAC